MNKLFKTAETPTSLFGNSTTFTTTKPVPTLPPPAPPKPKPDWKVEPEWADAYAQWAEDKSPASGAKLLKHMEPAIRAGVRTYAADSGPTGYGRAKAIVMKSLGSYDPTRAGLKTFVGQQLQSLQRFRAGQVNPIKIPERMLLMSNTLRKAESTLSDELGRAPSTSELSDHTGLPPTTIASIRKLKVALPEGGFSESYDEDSAYGSDPAVRPIVQDDAPWARMVYHSVGDRDRFILEHTLGLFGQPVLSNQAIAKKQGISPAAVSQRKAKLQAILDRREELAMI